MQGIRPDSSYPAIPIYDIDINIIKVKLLLLHSFLASRFKLHRGWSILIGFSRKCGTSSRAGVDFRASALHNSSGFLNFYEEALLPRNGPPPLRGRLVSRRLFYP